MRVAVCIKQVPETTEVKMNPETGTLIREGVPSIVNPFDVYALEEGIRLKERLGGSVVAVSMGPPQAKEALREALAMGVDEAVLLSDPAFAGADTLATAYTLARALEKLGPLDLVICGKQAVDGDTAQVGPGIAEELDIPHITYVRRIVDISESERRLKAERMIEGGIEVVETELPALITVVKDINQPRLPTLKGIMRAKRTEIKVWGPAEVGGTPERMGIRGSPTQVVRIFTPELRKKGLILQGPVDEQARTFVEFLKDARVF